MTLSLDVVLVLVHCHNIISILKPEVYKNDNLTAEVHLVQGGKSLQPFGEGKRGHENFRQMYALIPR